MDIIKSIKAMVLIILLMGHDILKKERSSTRVISQLKEADWDGLKLCDQKISEFLLSMMMVSCG